MSSPIITNGVVAGDRPAGEEPGLRLVFFGRSIVSDWENTPATNHRAFLQALADRGHQVVFLEERRNAPTVGLLKQRGSDPVRAFDRRFPGIPYRTYDLPTRREMDVWLGREASTADAVVVFLGTPSPCAEGIERLAVGHALKLFERDIEPAGSLRRSMLHRPATELPAMPYAPVVMTDQEGQDERDLEIVIVAYDDRELALATAGALPGATLLSAGSAVISDAPFVPEVELPDWYRRARVTVVVDRYDGRGVPVRALLPVASGSASVLVVPHDAGHEGWPFVTSTIEQLPITSSQARDRAGAAPDLQPFSAKSRAGELEQLVREHQQGG